MIALRTFDRGPTVKFTFTSDTHDMTGTAKPQPVHWHASFAASTITFAVNSGSFKDGE